MYYVWCTDCYILNLSVVALAKWSTASVKTSILWVGLISFVIRENLRMKDHKLSHVSPSDKAYPSLLQGLIKNCKCDRIWQKPASTHTMAKLTSPPFDFYINELTIHVCIIAIVSLVCFSWGLSLGPVWRARVLGCMVFKWQWCEWTSGVANSKALVGHTVRDGMGFWWWIAKIVHVYWIVSYVHKV